MNSQGFGDMDVTKPYEYIRFGAMDVTKPYQFIRFGAMDVTKPYEFITFGGYRRSWDVTGGCAGWPGDAVPGPGFRAGFGPITNFRAGFGTVSGRIRAGFGPVERESSHAAQIEPPADP